VVLEHNLDYGDSKRKGNSDATRTTFGQTIASTLEIFPMKDQSKLKRKDGGTRRNLQ